MMCWYFLVCCMLWCFGASKGLQCTSPHSTALKFTITSRRNQTGHWIAQVQLGHEAGHKDVGPWEVDVEHTTAKCENSESVLIVTTVTAPPLESGKPSMSPKDLLASGYELVPGLGYYKFHTNPKTWNESLKICEQEGTHLLVINSEKEVKALKSLWDKNPTIQGARDNYWAFIGFHDLYQEGKYVTIFNDTLASAGYLKWNGGRPLSGTNSNCGALGRNNEMEILICTHKYGFFCERTI